MAESAIPHLLNDLELEKEPTLNSSDKQIDTQKSQEDDQQAQMKTSSEEKSTIMNAVKPHSNEVSVVVQVGSKTITVEVNPNGEVFVKQNSSEPDQRTDTNMSKNADFLKPKSALMTLKEFKDVEIGCGHKLIINEGKKVSVMVNHKEYHGEGISEADALNDAYEKALRNYFLEKLSKKQNNHQANNGAAEHMECEADNNNNCENNDGMAALASFALFKLFSDWMSEGYVIPIFDEEIKATKYKNQGLTQNLSKTKSVVPALDFTNLCSSSYLNNIHPNLPYVELQPSLVDGKILRRVSVNIDGQEFEGIGLSKKLARRNAAARACNFLFNTNFPL